MWFPALPLPFTELVTSPPLDQPATPPTDATCDVPVDDTPGSTSARYFPKRACLTESSPVSNFAVS